MSETCIAELVEERLKNLNRYTMAATERVAAVLLPIVPDGNSCSVVFTKRIKTLNQHGGEVSFPGGMVDGSDGSPLEAALRETHEEIGVPPENVKILGTLHDEISRWGHRVTPFVGLMNSTDFRPQSGEVERIYKVPVMHLMNPGNYYSENWIKDGCIREVHFYRYQNDIIWGLTARILHTFLRHVHTQER